MKKEKRTQCVEGSHHSSYSAKKIDTVNKTEKSQESNKKVDTPKVNKTEKVKSIDKSRSTQGTDTENTVDK